MKRDIHPHSGPVVFRDRTAEFAFLARSTEASEQTIGFEDGDICPIRAFHLTGVPRPSLHIRDAKDAHRRLALHLDPARGGMPGPLLHDSGYVESPVPDNRHLGEHPLYTATQVIVDTTGRVERVQRCHNRG